MGHHEGFRRIPRALVWLTDVGGTPLGMKRREHDVDEEIETDTETDDGG